MKKIVAILLSAIMLLGVMTATVFADDEIIPWELEDWGQQSWTLYLNDREAPEVDGVIGEDEYALAITDLKVVDDVEDDRIFLVDFPGELEVNIYMDYDGDYLYVGVEILDPERVEGYVRNGKEVVDNTMTMLIGGDKNNIMQDSMIQVKLVPGIQSASNTDEVESSVNGDLVTYEYTIDRYTIMDKYGFDELDQVYIRYVITDVNQGNFENDALYNEMWFGFYTRDLLDVLPAHDPVNGKNNRFRYPHVVYFVDEPDPELTETEATEAPETEAPVTEAPVTEAPVTEAPETEAPADGGCGASVAAVGVALVAALGTCTVFVSKKR